MTRSLALLGASMFFLGACAQSLSPFGSAVGGGKPPRIFWPPPPATATHDTTVRAPSFGEMATSLARSFRASGYEDVRFYPIGARYEHGFAVTTRVERIDAAGLPVTAASGRWSDLFPEPVTLRWLEGAHEPRLPGPGRYQALLFAFTDLDFEGPRVPTERRETMMESTDAPPPLPTSPPASAGYRLLRFEYEYRGS